MIRSARHFIRRHLDRFWGILDSEAVELYQWLFYLIIAFDGAQNLFIAHGPPLTLKGSMSLHPYFEMWCGLEIMAPLCGLLGRVLHRTPFLRHPGNMLQLLGDLVLGSSELGYVVATFHIEPIGKGGHGGYLGLAFMLSAYLLAVRDWRRMRMERPR